MKKTLLFVLLLLSAITVSARTTYFNVRVGGGLTSGIDAPGKIDDAILRPAGGVTFMFQPNILIGGSKKFVLAPSLQYEYAGLGDEIRDHVVSLPILFGYRIKLSDGIFFVPKAGPTLGYRISNHRTIYNNFDISKEKEHFIAGAYLDLCFEIKRFVIGLNGYYSFTSQEIVLNDINTYFISKHLLSSSTEGSSLSPFHSYGLFMTFGYKF